MFRAKSKLVSNPPKPPTISEILEDLETFNLNHINRLRQKENTYDSLSTSDTSLNLMDSQKATRGDRKVSENEYQLGEWWNSFEKFLENINKLEEYQMQFQTKKSSLTKMDETVGLMADDIQTRVTDCVEKAMTEIPEFEQDLK